MKGLPLWSFSQNHGHFKIFSSGLLINSQEIPTFSITSKNTCATKIFKKLVSDFNPKNGSTNWSYPWTMMIHLEHALSAHRAVVTPVRLDLRTLWAVPDLALDRPHHDRDVLRYDQLLEGGLRVSRRLDGVELLWGQFERPGNPAWRGHDDLVVGPGNGQTMQLRSNNILQHYFAIERSE